jgi:hypothetical protein
MAVQRLGELGAARLLERLVDELLDEPAALTRGDVDDVRATEVTGRPVTRTRSWRSIVVTWWTTRPGR